jgi:hypothetical protein
MPFGVHGQGLGVGVGASSKNTRGHLDQLPDDYGNLCLFSVIATLARCPHLPPCLLMQ